MLTIARVLGLVLLVASARPAQGGKNPERPSPEELFKAQIVLDMAVAVTTSPQPEEVQDWSGDPDWRGTGNIPARTILVAVQITPQIIEAAVAHWGAGRDNVDASRRNDASKKLRKQFLLDGQKAFLTLVKPIVVPRGYRFADWWKLDLGRLSETMTIESLDGKTGSVTRGETTLDQPLTSNNAVVSALVFLNSPVDEGRDPSFSLVIRGIRYSVRREISLDVKGDWITQKHPATAHLRFETGSVRLLSLIENGVLWSDIENKYLEPKFNLVNTHLSIDPSLFLGIAADLIIGLLLKGL